MLLAIKLAPPVVKLMAIFITWPRRLELPILTLMRVPVLIPVVKCEAKTSATGI